MARAKKARPQKPVLRIRPLSLTDETMTILQAIAGDCTDLAGRAVSLSAVVRALAAYAQRQGYDWTRAHLLPLIEAEQRQIVWGKVAKRALKRC